MTCAFHIVCFFFFKQKTAYELRVSDWSSDVCSSDLLPELLRSGRKGACELYPAAQRPDRRGDVRVGERRTRVPLTAPSRQQARQPCAQIGRASWWERVCQYV